MSRVSMVFTVVRAACVVHLEQSFVVQLPRFFCSGPVLTEGKLAGC